MDFIETFLYNKTGIKGVRQNLCKCKLQEQFTAIRSNMMRSFVIFLILSSHITITSGYNKPPDDTDDSETEGSLSKKDYKICKTGLKLPGYSLKGGTKAGEYINLGSVNFFDECIDLCCKESDCQVAVMLTHKEQQKCFKVVCYDPDNESCQPVHATRQKEKYHPYLFLRGENEEISQKEGIISA